MNRSPILIRVDGTLRSGREHFARCMTLAGALQRRRRPTYFLSQLDPASLAFTVKRAGHDWIAGDHDVGSPDDLEQTLREIRRLQPAAVIVDSPDASEDYLHELAGSGAIVISMDHLGNIRFPSRLVINPLLMPVKEGYTYARGTQLLVGKRYALTRSEVRRVRPIRSQEPPQPFRALIALGDDDPNYQTGEIARLLLNTPRVQRVDMLVRPYHPKLEELRALAESCPERLEVATEPSEIMARLTRCHFAVTGGNAMALDLCCVGVPQLVIVQSESHWPTARALEDEGAAQCLGWHENVSPGTLRQAVQALLNDPLERQSMSRCGRKLIDGRGPDRLVTGIEVLLHSGRAAEAVTEAA